MCDVDSDFRMFLRQLDMRTVSGQSCDVLREAAQVRASLFSTHMMGYAMLGGVDAGIDQVLRVHKQVPNTGADCRNRTDDLPLTRRVLYQLS